MAEPQPAWVIPPALGGERVDRALALLTGYPRSVVSRLVEGGHVTLGRQVVTSRSRRVVAGERLRLDEAGAAAAAGPEGLPRPDPSVTFTVAYEDEDLIVVDKPAGLVTHPGAGNQAGTLVHGLLARYPDLAAIGGDPSRPGIVHRLDRGTSGLLAVARNAAARDHLIGQLASRSMERRYRSLVLGHVETDEGLVDAPIGRSHTDPTRMAVHADGREARTRYRVLGRQGRPVPTTLVECRLETGRTHQIRVHLAAIGHPLVGDDRYGGGRAVVLDGWRPLPAGRPWLHAEALAFDHPRTGERLRFSSLLPADLAGVLEQLG